MTGKKILITGTDGFIGSELFRYFSREDCSLHGTVFTREPADNEYRIDFRNPDELKGIPEGTYDAVIHTVGIVDQTQPSKTIFQVNAGCTDNILKWAPGRCRHFIQISSIGVYGMKTMGENRTEGKTKRYHGPLAIPYMRSKALAEQYIEKSGIPYTLLRLPAVLGRGDTFLSPSIISFMENKNFYLYGKRPKKISIMYVKNLGRIIEGLIDCGPMDDHFNCCDYHLSWDDFTAEYGKLLNYEIPKKRKSFLNLALHPKDASYQLIMTYSAFGSHFPTEKLSSVIDLEPRYSWRQGVQEAVERYRKITAP